MVKKYIHFLCLYLWCDIWRCASPRLIHRDDISKIQIIPLQHKPVEDQNTSACLDTHVNTPSTYLSQKKYPLAPSMYS